MGASQVECNMRGAGARCSQVGTFPTFSGIWPKLSTSENFLDFGNFQEKENSSYKSDKTLRRNSYFVAK